MDIKTLIQESNSTARGKGWWDEWDDAREKPTRMNNLLATKLFLASSELTEAMENLRSQGHPDHLAEELADAMIRIADFAGQMDIDLDEALTLKMEKNKKRPYRHGKAF
jgi:NTP pyrophosphatase (non-canonical NTP hydrolase)